MGSLRYNYEVTDRIYGPIAPLGNSVSPGQILIDDSIDFSDAIASEKSPMITLQLTAFSIQVFSPGVQGGTLSRSSWALCPTPLSQQPLSPPPPPPPPPRCSGWFSPGRLNSTYY